MGTPPILFLKVFDQTFFKKFVSSKGNALKGSPQRAEYPCGQGSLRWNLRRRPQTAKSPYFFEKKSKQKSFTLFREKALQKAFN